MALGRGKLLHARFLDTGFEDAAELPLFERAAGLYAGSWATPEVRANRSSGVGTYANEVILGQDQATAEPFFALGPIKLATTAGDQLTLSYVLRHLCFVTASRPPVALTRRGG